MKTILSAGAALVSLALLGGCAAGIRKFPLEEPMSVDLPHLPRRHQPGRRR
jgi:hypothetical protein